MAHIQKIQPGRAAMKRRLSLLADDISAGLVDIADQRKIRSLDEAPLRAWAESLAFGNDRLGANCVAADNVDAQLGALVGEGAGERLCDIRADASGSAC